MAVTVLETIHDLSSHVRHSVSADLTYTSLSSGKVLSSCSLRYSKLIHSMHLHSACGHPFGDPSDFDILLVTSDPLIEPNLTLTSYLSCCAFWTGPELHLFHSHKHHAECLTS